LEQETAKFHALSYKKWNGEGTAILNEFPFLKEGQWLNKNEICPIWVKFVTNSFPEIVRLLEQKGFLEESQRIQTEFEIDKIFERMERLTAIPTKYPSVINHGDLWTNNILFKYDTKGGLNFNLKLKLVVSINYLTNSQGTIQELKFVDFQASRVGSRILDLSYLLFTSVQNDVLNGHLLDLLKIYFHTFEEHVAASKPTFKDHALSWEDFMEEWEEFKNFGLTLTVMFAPPSKVESKLIQIKSLQNFDFSVCNRRKHSRYGDAQNVGHPRPKGQKF